MSMDRTTHKIGIKAAAERLDVSEKTIRRQIANGTLPACRIGRQIRIDVADLDVAFKAVR